MVSVDLLALSSGAIWFEKQNEGLDVAIDSFGPTGTDPNSLGK